MIETREVNGVKVFRLAGSFLLGGYYFTAAYYLDGLMIDSGCARTARDLVKALSGHSVRLIVNTHHHEDHIGGNRALQDAFGAEARIHPEGLRFLTDPNAFRPLHPYRFIMWGRPETSRGEPLGDEVETPEHRFRVIHTPGHSPDHVVLFEPETGYLFTGDAYVGGLDRSLRADYNIWQIIESLKKMKALRPKVLFAGSGSVKEDAEEHLAEKIEYLENAGDRVLDLHQKGWSIKRIRREVFGPEVRIAYITLGHFSGKQLVRSYINNNIES